MELKIAIIYVSSHHGNTRKVIESMSSGNPVDLIDVLENKEYDLSQYDIVGIGSGVAFGKYYRQMLDFLTNRMPSGKKVFFVHTAGDPREAHNAAAKAITDGKGCQCLGTFFCKGFDTYGPFKLIGGINKKHPDQEDLDSAKAFFQKLL